MWEHTQWMSNFRRENAVLFVQNEPSSKDYWSQTVWARTFKICTRLVHIRNNQNVKGHWVNPKTGSVRAYTVNVKFPPETAVLVVELEPSLKSYKSQTVWASEVTLCRRLVHIQNNLNVKEHGVNPKTVSVRPYAVNVKFPSKKCCFDCTTWVYFKKVLKPNHLS